jgi:hypothetical protein
MDPVKRTLAWRALVRELYRRTAAYARRMADVMYANIMATPFQLLPGWTSYIDDGTRPPDPDAQTTAAEQQLAREILDNWIQECIYRDTCIDTHEKRREFATLVKRMIENEFADMFKICKSKDKFYLTDYTLHGAYDMLHYDGYYAVALTEGWQAVEQSDILQWRGLREIHAQVLEAINADMFDFLMHTCKPEEIN